MWSFLLQWFCVFVSFEVNPQSFGSGLGSGYRDAGERLRNEINKVRGNFFDALNQNLNYCVGMSKEDIRILKISVTSGDSILMDSIGDINKIYTGYKKKYSEVCKWVKWIWIVF